MYDRTRVDLRTCDSSSNDYPPWRETSIPVELFNLIAAPPSTSVRLYRLHYDILQFYHFMIPKKEENEVRQQVINRICDVIRQYLPAVTIDIYGSHKTGLNLPMSDIDLIVYSSDGRHWDSEELLKIMSDLRNDFCRFGVCRQEEIQVLHSATVPIIKLTDHRTDVKVDMSFNMNGGPRSTQLILDYLKIYPYMKYLFYVLKQYLYQLDLNTVWTGGISSYSLILMLVGFFQSYYVKDSQIMTRSSASTIKPNLTIKLPSHHPNTTDDCSSSISYTSSSAASCGSSDDPANFSNPSSDNDDDPSNLNRAYQPSNFWIEHINLGHMLLSFLQFYGVYFDYAKLGIRVDKPNQTKSIAGFIDKEELFKNFCCGHRTTTNLCIVDPFNDKNDIGKATWLIPKLQVAFRDAFEILSKCVSNDNPVSDKAPTILSKILTVNERIIAYRENLARINRQYHDDQQMKQRRLTHSIFEYPHLITIPYPTPIAYPDPFIHHLQPLRTTAKNIDNQYQNAPK